MYKEVSNYLGSSEILTLNPFWISIKICLSVCLSSFSSSSGFTKLIANPFVPNLPARPTRCKQVSLSRGKSSYKIICTIIDDKVDSLDINTSTEQISSNQKSRSVCLEQIIILDSFLLFQIRVNADRIEKFLFQKLCQFLSSFNFVYENYCLVEG